MALEDRDWYREEPSKAWRKRWNPSPGSARTDGRTTRGPVRAYHGAWLAILVSAALAAAAWHWNIGATTLHLGSSPSPALLTSSSANAPQPTPPTGSSSKIVRLRSAPGFDTPATTVKNWWIIDRRFGKISVDVPIGQTPREALTVALAARGYQVVP